MPPPPPRAPVRLRVLLVEDSEDDATLLERELVHAGYLPEILRVETAAAMQEALATRPLDIVISDYSLPHFSAPSALAELQTSGLDLPLIVVSGTVGESVAVESMRAGAHDYLMKDNLARLGPAIQRALRDADARLQKRQEEAAWQEEARISAALARVGREMILSLETPTLLERLCRVTAEVLSCDASYTLMLRPSDDEAYTVVAGYGTPTADLDAARLIHPPANVLDAFVSELEDQDVVQFPRVSTDLLSAAEQQHFGVAAVLCLALRRGKQLIGVQIVGCRQPIDAFTPEQQRVARGTAQLASMALAHARVIEELVRASRLKSEFVATMSHELRTPLNIIMGYTDLLMDGTFGPMSGEQRDSLDRIERSARQLHDLIGATLDLSRLESGRMPLTPGVVRVRELLHELGTEMEESQRERTAVAVVWQVAPDLPDLYTDPSKVKLVLKNLIGNALKFTDRGSVTVGAAARDAGVELAVTDTGIGIEPEALSIIFEPYRQADSSATRRHDGVGLGLYIVSRLLDMLGGRVSVESTVGRGSTFRVWLPLKP